jgi:DNA-binding transcriptional LysR family regulator
MKRGILIAMLEHRQLQFFLSVCDEKSFSKAAERCFISQQGLSKSIKLLEDQLEVPLFVRTKHGIELTEFGQELEVAAKSYINHHDLIVDTIHRLKENKASRLILGLPSAILNIFRHNFFKTFIETYPDISLKIMTFPDIAFKKSLQEYEVHVCFFPGPLDKDLFESFFCIKRKIDIVVGQKHKFASRASIKLEELKGEMLISLDNQIYPQTTLTALCEQKGIEPNIIICDAQKDLIFELCSTNKIASFWAPDVPEDSGLIRVELEDVDLYWEMNLAVNKNAYLSPAAKQFIEYTKSVII